MSPGSPSISLNQGGGFLNIGSGGDRLDNLPFSCPFQGMDSVCVHEMTLFDSFKATGVV